MPDDERLVCYLTKGGIYVHAPNPKLIKNSKWRHSQEGWHVFPMSANSDLDIVVMGTFVLGPTGLPLDVKASILNNSSCSCSLDGRTRLDYDEDE